MRARLFSSVVAISLALLPLADFARAATKALTFSDGICEYRVAYDPKRVDGTRLKATFDYLADGSAVAEMPPSFSTPQEIAALDVPGYRARCAARRTRLAALRFVEGAGVEAVRDRQLAELDATCRRVEATLAAAKGDVGPMRAASPPCTRYADLVALPALELKARWNDLVVDLCQTSTEVNICAGHLQRSGEGPGSEIRRRNAVLDRWNECVVARAPAVDTDPEKSRLRDRLAKRFKAKALSCAQ